MITNWELCIPCSEMFSLLRPSLGILFASCGNFFMLPDDYVSDLWYTLYVQDNLLPPPESALRTVQAGHISLSPLPHASRQTLAFPVNRISNIKLSQAHGYLRVDAASVVCIQGTFEILKLTSWSHITLWSHSKTRGSLCVLDSLFASMVTTIRCNEEALVTQETHILIFYILM